MVKKFLDDNSVEYSDKDVSIDQAAKDEMVKLTGRLAVPVVVIDGEVTIGFDEGGIKKKLGL